MNVSEVLNRAADLIEERGWTQGPNGWRTKGPVCAMGGVGAALNWRVVNGNYCCWELATTPAMTALGDYLDVTVGQDGQGVYLWNDAKDRTAAEVIETLRAAAIIAAASETDVTVVAPEPVSA